MATLVKYNRLPSLFDRLYTMPTVPQTRTTAPAVNIREDEKAYHLEVAAPGYKKEEFSINVLLNRLTISARQEEKKEEASGTFTRREFGFSSFERSFQLPKHVNSDEIQATYTDGILTVTVPKVEVKQPEAKQIAIA
ncbi:Hsp20/alpha crystallin family protein [Tellurirhabdus rosea]|uniref:Hsp20/alpha crystallin family protein n=1 Tax=Tellurirhabdus rosea TaxID=2674997 RepID=UPI00224FF805|nr:Hsp20/alpha crystallin family protein [Tellurirhabdus rosea]